MAPLSHMVVYNYNSCTDNKSNSVDNTKILVNKLLSYMKSSGNRFIYIIDIECEHQSSTTNSNSNPCTPWWQSIDQSYFDNDSDELHWYNNAIINQIIKSPRPRTIMATKLLIIALKFSLVKEIVFNKFHRLEQNLIWKMYGKHWILNNKVCVGNILDFHQIQEKMIINSNWSYIVKIIKTKNVMMNSQLYKIYNIFKIICWGIIFTILI